MCSVLAERKTVVPAKRYRVNCSSGASVTDDCSPTSATIRQLPQNTIVVGAEVRVDENGHQRVRISLPAGWLGADALEPAEPASSLWLDFETFQRCHLEVAPGDYYGLKLPFTIDLLREFGPQFLTAAFRA